MLMRYAVFGPREIKREVYTNKTYIAQCLGKVDDLTFMVCGGGQGVEILAEQVAIEEGIEHIRIPPNFKTIGEVKPTTAQVFDTRNIEMLVQSDAAIVFWDGVFAALMPVIQRAIAMRKRVILFPLY